MNYDRAAMKQEVRQAMKQARPHPMLVTLLFLVLAAAVPGLVSWGMNTLFSNVGGGVEISMDDLLAGIMNEGSDYLFTYFSPEFYVQLIAQAALVSTVVSLLTTIWNGLMNTGYAGYCLDMVQGTNPGLGRIFCGFPRAGSVILAYILVAIFTFLWSMLFAIIYGVVVGILGVLLATLPDISLLAALLMLPATAGYIFAIVWVVLRYSMVPYAVIDSQTSLSALDAIRTSKTLMKGRKGRYFVLQFSFIGWYLLEYLVVMVGAIIAVAAVAGTASAYMDRIEELLSYINDYGYEIVILMLANDYLDISWLTGLLSQLAIFIIPITLVCGAAIFIINLWLTPYRAGSEARFYIYAMGGQPSQPDSQSGQPIQSGAYSGQPGQPFGGQPGQPFGGQPGQPFGGQPGQPFGGQPGQPFGGQPGQPFGGQPGQPFGGQPGQPFGGQPGQPFGGQPGQPFSGYAQEPQPPQHGEGTYSQGDAPQAPADSVAEPAAAPAAPAAPQIPQVPAAPTDSQIPQASFTPAAPQTPQAPFTPAAPQTPQAPFAPAAPQAPQAPFTPAAPQAPQVPFTPADPQAPQAPAYSAAEPPAAPSVPVPPEAPSVPETPVVFEAPIVFGAPAAPEAPVIPETPELPKTTLFPEPPVIPEPFVPTRLAEPIDDIPFEEPYAEPEAPHDDTPQQPGGPNYPQY